MKTLTDSEAEALTAFCECSDLHTTGVWATIADAMRDEFGISDPEGALEDARRALE